MRTLRQALRSLLATPGFTAIAVLTLGLGVGANTAIFSVVDAILLRPLPLPNSGQLVSVRESSRTFPSMSVAYPNYLDWSAQNHSFSSIAAFNSAGGVLTQDGPPEQISGRQVSGNYFQTLGVAPALGRGILPSDDVLGATDVIVLSAEFFRQHFGNDPRWIGQTLTLDAKPRVIVGVMPPHFPGFGTARFNQYFVPLGPTATKASGLLDRGSHPGISCIGRLRPGVTLAQARADMTGIARLLAQQYPKDDTGQGIAMAPLLQQLVGPTRPALLLLLAAVGFVLLIACANVANLLLARAAGRQKAFAIRSALGASRRRLAAEPLAESLWLGIAGSGLGLLLAGAGMQGARALIPASVPRGDGIGLDWRVLGFAVVVALGTSLLFGVAPALQASRARLSDVLKEGGREAGGGVTGARLRSVLVALEMGLALLLLVGAGLLLRSLAALERVDPGFNPHQVLTFEVGIPDARYPVNAQRDEFFRQALDRLRALPGVASVGAVLPLPFGGSDWEEGYSIPGRPVPLPSQRPSTDFAMVRGDYFAAMGIHLLRGRAFTDTDTATSTPVIIIDDSFAKLVWPHQEALGQQVQLNGAKRLVVGIVPHVKNYGLDGASRVESFIPALQQTGFGVDDLEFAVRTRGSDPLALRAAATAAIQAVDAEQPLDDMQTMDERVAFSLAQRHLTLWIMALFAALALCLAAIGIYGVMSYAVAQRSREIGIRMALGAGRGDVLRLVMRQGMTLALAGAVAGLVAAVLAGRALASFLYGVGAADPRTLLTVPCLLLAIAALACYIPARRATGVDPNHALRCD